ncbi:hypothetical protein ACLOJK_010085 [Asimina triloba]
MERQKFSGGYGTVWFPCCCVEREAEAGEEGWITKKSVWKQHIRRGRKVRPVFGHGGREIESPSADRFYHGLAGLGRRLNVKKANERVRKVRAKDRRIFKASSAFSDPYISFSFTINTQCHMRL